ncbi:hypothetical protein ES708_11900 [subsurface metagenome]
MSENKQLRNIRKDKLIEMLTEAKKEACYYQNLSEEAGKRSIREIDQLSQLYNELKLAEKQMKYRIELDVLMNSISTKMLQLTYDEINDGIQWALGMIGNFHKVDRCYIFRFSENGKIMTNTHEWCAEDIEPQIDKLQSLKTDDFLYIMKRFANHKTAYFPRVADIEDRVLNEHFQIQQIQSLISVPMYYNDKLFGFIGFDSVRSEKTWNEEEILIIELICNIFVNALQRMRTEEKHRKLEEQLQIRQRMDSIVTLAGGIAHDFNNLLIAISGNMELLTLSADNLTQKQKEYIIIASTSLQHAANLIKNIQALSETAISEKKSVDLYGVAKEVFRLLDVTTNKLIEKQLSITPSQFYINANADQLHQVLLNLGTNSVTTNATFVFESSNTSARM